MHARYLNAKLSGLPDGPGMLLSNSLGTTMAMWQPQLALLEAHYKVVRYDTRGHGHSPTSDAPFTLEDLVADAFGLLDRFEIQTATVIGCSLGGMTGLGMGLTDPDRVTRIVCTAARADAPAPFRKNWDERMDVIRRAGVGDLWDGSLSNWLTADFRAANPDVVARMKADYLLTTDLGYTHCAMALKGLDYLKDLGALQVPTAFISGAEDQVATPATMSDMANICPQGSSIEIPNAGHIVNVNAPDAYRAALSEFLDLS